MYRPGAKWQFLKVLHLASPSNLMMSTIRYGSSGMIAIKTVVCFYIEMKSYDHP